MGAPPRELERMRDCTPEMNFARTAAYLSVPLSLPSRFVNAENMLWECAHVRPSTLFSLIYPRETPERNDKRDKYIAYTWYAYRCEESDNAMTGRVNARNN